MPARHLADEHAPMGRAYGLWDLIVFLHRAGLDVGEEDDIAASHLIWIGARPDHLGAVNPALP
jgi:hypothetical protein